MAKLLLLCTLLVVMATAATAPGPMTMIAPKEAFGGAPSAFACMYDQIFCAGYFTGEAMPLPVPDPKLYKDYWTWRAVAIYPLMPPVIIQAPLMSRIFSARPAITIDGHAVGVVSAMVDASLWIWKNYPTGCGVVDCNPAKPVVRRHLDLTGKVVKGTVKVGYKAARVIL